MHKAGPRIALAASLGFAFACGTAAAQSPTAPGPAAAPAAAAKPAPATGHLTAFKARYQASYRGISGGQIEQWLHPGTAAGQWVFEARAYPNLLGRIAVSPDARQRSLMDLTPAGVRPLTLVFDDGSDSSEKDVNVTFDWATSHVRGRAKEKTFDYPVQPGTQDTVSVQVAMIQALVSGQAPTSFWILNGAKLEQYRYWPEGRATVVTPYGQFETVVWASQRDGSKRVNKVWHAPSLGYVPVQAIQYNKGRPDVQLKLVSLER
ncbi:MAG: DUF3108 domain-containing protein [Steroidobacteraceae bacterium]